MFVWSKQASAESEDLWEERLLGDGQTNVVISRLPGGKSIRVEVYADRKKSVDELVSRYGGSFHRLKEQNWAALAPPPVRPIRIRDALIVVPGEDPDLEARLAQEFPARPILAIPPALAFGTGDHATTATCLRMLVDCARHFGERPWSLLDAGTGSGILAIAACKLGAKPIDAFDFDPMALRVARANARRHGASRRIRFTERNALKWRPGKSERWDCITANLFSDVLAGAFPAITRALHPEGFAILSGILDTHANECLAAGQNYGFGYEKIVRRGKWVTALAILR